MGIWKARLMALLSMVAMLLALAAPVALADHDDEDIGFPLGADVFDDDEDEFGDDDEEDFDGDVSIESIDCFDEVDNDNDGLIDEDVDDELCRVEAEIFDEEVVVFVEADEIEDALV
jgi:hypothetical protein